ncbi:hypothetical protein, partial [Moorena sp. SIO3H5]|uniref:hypothetical protein n=1 Tax=Moorena sp. SIO3H5 TaxID=2607834 RepID=UPI0013BD7E90
FLRDWGFRRLLFRAIPVGILGILDRKFPTPVLMQSLMGGTPKTALHRYSLLPTPYSLLPLLLHAST